MRHRVIKNLEVCLNYHKLFSNKCVLDFVISFGYHIFCHFGNAYGLGHRGLALERIVSARVICLHMGVGDEIKTNCQIESNLKN